MDFLNRYKTPADLPRELSVFPLPGALLLPRAELPLNIFEPRYLEMVASAMAGDRLIGMIQPEDEDADLSGNPGLQRIGCAGRITSYAETQDNRILISLTGIARFVIVRETPAETAYRRVVADFTPFASDLISDEDSDDVDRSGLLRVFRDYLAANDLSADWEQVNAASTETLVNTLSLLAPYGPRDKQALLEAPDLKSRADVLIALTEIALARGSASAGSGLQ